MPATFLGARSAVQAAGRQPPLLQAGLAPVPHILCGPKPKGGPVPRRWTSVPLRRPQGPDLRLRLKARAAPETEPSPPGPSSKLDEAPSPPAPTFSSNGYNHQRAFGVLKWLLYIMGATALVNPEYVAAAYFKVQPTAYASHLGRCLGAVCFMLTGAVYYLQTAAQNSELEEVWAQRVGTAILSMSAFLVLLDMPASHRASFFSLLLGGLGIVGDFLQEAGYATRAARYALLAVTHSLWAFALMFLPGLFTKVVFDGPAVEMTSGLSCLLRTVGAAHVPAIAMLHLLMEQCRAEERQEMVVGPKTLHVVHLSLGAFAGILLLSHLHAIFTARIAAPLVYSVSITIGSFLPAVLVVGGALLSADSKAAPNR